MGDLRSMRGISLQKEQKRANLLGLQPALAKGFRLQPTVDTGNSYLEQYPQIGVQFN